MVALKVNHERCIGCAKCIPYCPMGCIEMKEKKAVIDQAQCIECGICVRQIPCPTKAFYEPEEVNRFPRSVRKVFSDPTAKHENTGVRGRGTEEVKTNDVTGRFRRGEIGFALEFGRPAKGCILKDVEVMTIPLTAAGVELEPCNPLTFLLEPETGAVRADVREEKVLSAIVEFIIPIQRLQEICSLILAQSKQAATVFSWGMVVCYNPDGSLPAVDVIEELGISVPRNIKLNVGLGRPFKEV